MVCGWLALHTKTGFSLGFSRTVRDQDALRSRLENDIIKKGRTMASLRHASSTPLLPALTSSAPPPPLMSASATAENGLTYPPSPIPHLASPKSSTRTCGGSVMPGRFSPERLLQTETSWRYWNRREKCYCFRWGPGETVGSSTFKSLSSWTRSFPSSRRRRRQVFVFVRREQIDNFTSMRLIPKAGSSGRASIKGN